MSNILSTKIASKISLALVAFGVVAVMSVVGAKPAMAKQHDINYVGCLRIPIRLHYECRLNR